jgi:hypothetical protein
MLQHQILLLPPLSPPRFFFLLRFCVSQHRGASRERVLPHVVEQTSENPPSVVWRVAASSLPPLGAELCVRAPVYCPDLEGKRFIHVPLGVQLAADGGMAARGDVASPEPTAPVRYAVSVGTLLQRCGLGAWQPQPAGVSATELVELARSFMSHADGTMVCADAVEAFWLALNLELPVPTWLMNVLRVRAFAPFLAQVLDHCAASPPTDAAAAEEMLQMLQGQFGLPACGPVLARQLGWCSIEDAGELFALLRAHPTVWAALRRLLPAEAAEEMDRCLSSSLTLAVVVQAPEAEFYRRFDSEEDWRRAVHFNSELQQDTAALACVLEDRRIFAPPTVLVQLRAHTASDVSGVLEAARALMRPELLLFCYTGHGWYDEEAEETLLTFMDGSALTPAALAQLLPAIGAESTLVVLDCCHAEGVFARTIFRGLAVMPFAATGQRITGFTRRHLVRALRGAPDCPVGGPGCVHCQSFRDHALRNNEGRIGIKSLCDFMTQHLALECDHESNTVRPNFTVNWNIDICICNFVAPALPRQEQGSNQPADAEGNEEDGIKLDASGGNGKRARGVSETERENAWDIQI